MTACPVCEHAQLQGAECERCGMRLAGAAGGAAPVFAERLDGLESTHAAPVDAYAPPLPDLERTRAAIPGDAPTALPVAVVCRYCRTPSPPGERLCGRCGMRLPTFAPAVEAESATAGPRTCGCGARVRGPRCPSCGARFE